MKIPFRQGIVRYQTDILDNQTFLVPNVGVVDLQVTNENTIINFAHKNADYLFTERRSIPSAWVGPFTPGTDYWLYWEINLTTGEREFGNTEIEPVFGLIAPALPQVGQMWFDTTLNYMKEFNGVRWVEKVRVVAAKYASGAVLQAWNGGALFSGTQIANAQAVSSGYLVYDDTNKPLKQTNGTFLTSEDGFTSGISTASQIRLEALLFEAEAGTNIAAYSIVYVNDFDRILPASPTLTNNNAIGIIEEDAFTGERIHVTVSGVIGNPAWNWSTAGAELYIDNTGQIVDVVQPGMSPLGYVIDPQQILLKTAGVTNVTVDSATSVGFVGTDNATGTIEIDPTIHWHTFNQTGAITFTIGPHVPDAVSKFTIEIESDSTPVTWPVEAVGDTSITDGVLNLFNGIVRPAIAGLAETLYIIKVPLPSPVTCNGFTSALLAIATPNATQIEADSVSVLESTICPNNWVAFEFAASALAAGDVAVNASSVNNGQLVTVDLWQDTGSGPLLVGSVSGTATGATQVFGTITGAIAAWVVIRNDESSNIDIQAEHFSF